MLLHKLGIRRKKSKYKNYFICTIQRSGKSWLCDLLARLNHFGAPEEYLNYIFLPDEQFEKGKSMQNLYASKGLDGVREFVQHVNREKTGHEGPAGLVIQLGQLQLLADREGLTKIEMFKKLYTLFDEPNIFFLERRDVAAQAVSIYFVVETGMAHHYQEKSGDEKTYEEIEYDQQKLLEWYDSTLNGYKSWRNVLKGNNITPHMVTYEELRDNLYTTLSGMTDIINPNVEVSSDQVESVSSQGFSQLKISKKTAFTKKFKKSLS